MAENTGLDQVMEGILDYENSHNTPIIYFDIAPAYGTMDGIVQVELGARVLIPRPDGSTAVKVVSCGRLRCSAQAATYLRDVLDASLNILEGPKSQPVAQSQLN